MKKLVKVIGAYASDGSYGQGNGMPWPRGGIPDDMKRFKQETSDTPPGEKNALIVGAVTGRTMGNVPLGENRILIWVSRSIAHPEDYGSGYGPGRFCAATFQQAHLLAIKLGVHTIFYAGGESSWIAGLKIADEAILTIAEKTCDGDDIKRLQTPLHELAREQGLQLRVLEEKTNERPDPWVKKYRFERWVKA